MVRLRDYHDRDRGDPSPAASPPCPAPTGADDVVLAGHDERPWCRPARWSISAMVDASWGALAVVAAASIAACAASPVGALDGRDAVSARPAAPVTPSCGRPGLGEPWPSAPASGGAADEGEPTWVEVDGVMAGAPASLVLLTACDDRISATTCRIRLRAEPSMFGPERGTSVRSAPAADALAIVARLRADAAAQGFRETMAFEGTATRIQAFAALVPARGQLAARDVPAGMKVATLDPARFEGVAEPRGAAFGLERGAVTRVVVIVCQQASCTVEVVEALAGCDGETAHRASITRAGAVR